MRKWIALLILFFVLVLSAVYLFTPNKVSFRQTEQVVFSQKAFSRALFNEVSWQQWWPGEAKKAPSFRYNGNTYTIREKKISSLLIHICNEKDTLATELVFIPVNENNIELEWIGRSNSAATVFSRVQTSRWLRTVETDVKTLLQTIKSFYSKVDNLYPIPIRETKVADSLLISTSATSKHHPTPEFIYTLLDKLQAYAATKGARQTGLPMLNITPSTDSTFFTRVALPVNKKLPNTSEIQYRWMLGGGNILVTEIKGGPHRIEQAFATMEQYIDDFNRIAPAIPFQSLVTDRRTEPDTTKWLTKVYWPVM